MPAEGLAVVIGSGGGLGAAFVAALTESGRFHEVIGYSRRTEPAVDITVEASVAAAAAAVAARNRPLRLVIVATGFLHGQGFRPERSWRDLDPAHMAYAYANNVVGPALLMKHFLPLLAPQDKAVFAALSARVGSIEDNRLGGWYSYRATKAALNQLVRTAAIELRRQRPGAICVALHPGTVATALSDPFAKLGLDVQAPPVAAGRLLRVIDGLGPQDSGTFVDYGAERVPW